jgi:hypothetical protein
VAKQTRRFRFLVDIWAEGREVEALPYVLRGRVRDLRTDEETYVGSFEEIEEAVEARLDGDDVRPRRWGRS